jgi:hypothetical protein
MLWTITAVLIVLWLVGFIDFSCSWGSDTHSVGTSGDLASRNLLSGRRTV